MLLVLIQAFGCSSQAKKEIAKEKKLSEPIVSRFIRYEKARDAINKAAYLNSEEKEKLFSIQDNMMDEVDKIREEEGQLHSVLIKTMSEKDFNESKMNRIAKELKRLNKKRVKTRMSAFRKARNVMRGERVNSQIYHHLWDYDSMSVTR